MQPMRPLSVALLAALCIGAQSPPDLQGRWARLEVTTALSRVPMLGDVTSETRAISIVDVTEREGTLVVDERICDLENDSLGGAVQARFPKAFLKAVSGNRNTARIERTTEGLRYFEARPTRVKGANLADPEADPLPKRSDDPRVHDMDGDGQPGLTVKVQGLVDGEIYVVQRDASRLQGKVRPNGRQIQGIVRWRAEQEVVGASRSMLESNPDNRPHPEAQRSFFRMLRVPDSAGCEDVRRRRRALFGK